MNTLKALPYLSFLAFAMILTSCNKKSENSIITPIPCLPSNLHNNVIAFYPFSEGSIQDISGNNRNLENNTTAKPTSDRNDNENCAYLFQNNATNTEYLTTTSTTFLNNLNSFSVSLWYQAIDTSRGNSDYEGLIHRDATDFNYDTEGQWSLGLYDCRKPVFGRLEYASAWDTTYNSNYSCKKQIELLTGNWKHLVGTFNISTSTTKIYTNGMLIDSDNRQIQDVSDYEDIGDLFIGKNYSGKIDDIMIFNKALSQKEVESIFNLESCCQE